MWHWWHWWILNSHQQDAISLLQVFLAFSSLWLWSLWWKFAFGHFDGNLPLITLMEICLWLLWRKFVFDHFDGNLPLITLMEMSMTDDDDWTVWAGGNGVISWGRKTRPSSSYWKQVILMTMMTIMTVVILVFIVMVIVMLMMMMIRSRLVCQILSIWGYFIRCEIDNGDWSSPHRLQQWTKKLHFLDFMYFKFYVFQILCISNF